MKYFGFYRYRKPITWVRVEKVVAFAKRHGWPEWFIYSIVRKP